MFCKLTGKRLETDVVEKSQYECASPIVLVQDKDVTFRFCVIFWRFSAGTMPDTYYFLRMDNYFYSFEEAYASTDLDAL